MQRKLMYPILAVILLCPGLAAQQKGPKALVVEPNFAMGYVPQNCKVAHTYWINNIGTDSLKIFKVNLTCGCTKAPIDKGTIAPNDSMPLEIIFDAGIRTKDQNRSAMVVCNDPVASKFEVSFTCYVCEVGEATGPIVLTKNQTLKLTTNDRGKSFPVTFKNVSKGPLTAKLIASPSEFVSVEMPKAPVAAGATGEIIVRVEINLKEKNCSKSFTFEVSGAAKTRYTIPVRMAEAITDLKKYERRAP